MRLKLASEGTVLRSFRVENHKSIKDEAELVLLPTYAKAPLAVPVAGIFGANASGKSSLLGAMKWMRDAVTSSHFQWDPQGGVPRQPFLLDDFSRAAPSVFATEVVIDDVRHMYGFVVDDQQVLEEWLYTYPKNRKRVIFEREDGKITFGSTVGEAKDRATLLADMTRPNALLVSVAARSKLPAAAAVAGWFDHGLRVVDGRHGPGQGRRLARMIEADPRRAGLVIDLLRAADVGMSLPFAEESAGTHAWLGLTMDVVEALDQGLVLAVDEIDSSLHPRLTAHLITLFHSADVNPHGAQLIFVTHDASLLGSVAGKDILRRDEVWFVEKDRDTGASTLFPLTDFHPRKEDNTERRYLGGSYGAVPFVAEQDFRRALGLDPWEIVNGATA